MWWFCVYGVVLMFSECIHNANSIQCYQCYLVERPYYLQDGQQVRTCKDFDYSDTYLVDCPESTFCYKKTVQDNFYKTDYVRQERGCAQQVYRGQTYESNLGWRKESHVVSNAYESGCRKNVDSGVRTLDVEDCYCEGDLCNSGLTLGSFRVLGLIFVILLLNKV